MFKCKNYLISIEYWVSVCILLSLAALSLTGCSNKHKAYVSTSTTIRDNTPSCLVPEAPGTVVFDNEYTSVDASNSSEGYVMVTYLGENPNVKLQIIGPDNMTYTYDLHDNNPETFPLSAGNGGYNINVYEAVGENNMYSAVFNASIDVSISNEHGAYLYPNQYVKFNKDSNVVSKCAELVANAHDDLEAINYVYNYLIENVTYDEVKAATVESGYIPDVDEILSKGTGICLDYSAVMVSMLRSQGIPARMEVGYAGTAYHAWISAYAENIGWINGLVEFDGTSWSLMDPTIAANSGEDRLAKFIGEGDNYLTQFVY